MSLIPLNMPAINQTTFQPAVQKNQGSVLEQPLQTVPSEIPQVSTEVSSVGAQKISDVRGQIPQGSNPAKSKGVTDFQGSISQDVTGKDGIFLNPEHISPVAKEKMEKAPEGYKLVGYSRVNDGMMTDNTIPMARKDKDDDMIFINSNSKVNNGVLANDTIESVTYEKM